MIKNVDLISTVWYYIVQAVLLSVSLLNKKIKDCPYQFAFCLFIGF